MDRVAATFLRGQFAIFGKILRTSSVKYSEEFTEASCVMQFRTSKHVEMIIQKVCLCMVMFDCYVTFATTPLHFM